MQYRFNDFEIDPERYELRKAGGALHVEPMVFDLLLFFARNAGRVLPRDEIVEHVWKGRSVSDATISSCIKSARRVLGDSGESQNLIKTVRGRGFEFAVEVIEVSDAHPPESSNVGKSNTQADHRENDNKAQSYEYAVVRRRHDPTKELAGLPVLAVLPFTNHSAEADDYFADGLTEDIIINLSRFRDLRVIAGASTFQFKDRSVDLSALCADLNAGYVVQGSVRRAAGRVRITTQLIDGATGVQLWGDRYDREMGDIFELQDEVTRTIATTLGIKVQGVQLQSAMTKNATELDAYDCLLRARRYTWLLSSDMHAEARDLLERAVELDPMSSDAHALLANVYLGEHRFDMNPRPNPVGRALVHALAATQLDPQNAYARCWLAITYFFRGENEKFEAESKLALELNPHDPETLADIGHYLAFMGEFERGVALSKHAQALNPLHPGWYYFSFARLHYNQQDYEATLADVQRVGLPHFYWSHLLNAASKGQLGRSDASDSIVEIYKLKPDFSASGELNKWNAAPDDLEHILDGLRRAGLDNI